MEGYEDSFWLGNGWEMRVNGQNSYLEEEIESKTDSSSFDFVSGDRVVGSDYKLFLADVEDLEHPSNSRVDYSDIENLESRKGVIKGREPSVPPSIFETVEKESENVVLDGNRNLEALRELGIEKVPIWVVDYTEEQAASRSVSEHLLGPWNTNDEGDVSDNWISGDEAYRTAEEIVDYFGEDVLNNDRVRFSFNNF